jgi:integrase
MRTTFNIGFVCRKSKITKTGRAPVELSIIINGKRTYLVLPRKEYPDEFKRLVGARRRNDLKDYLETVYQNVMQKQTEMMQKGIAVNSHSLKDYLVNGCTDSYTIEQLFDEYLAILRKRVDVDMSLLHYQKFEIVRDAFYRHISKDKQVSEITNGVIRSFFATLNQENQQSTAAGKMAKLKTVIMFARDNNRLQTNPFANIKITRKEKPVEFLTSEEVRQIESKVFNSDRLTKVRDLFLFQCYTGLAYTDMARLKKEDFRVNDMGQTYIKKPRMKTGIDYTVVMLDEPMAILKKYDYQLPILTNQKYNSYLKEIGDLCGITKPLHTHIGRHTCATFLLNKGMSLDYVAKILGHSNTKQTKHYAKLLDQSVFKEFKLLEERRRG